MLWARELIARNAPVRVRPTRSTSELLSNRVTGAYLGLAIGDALGATVEFLTPNEIRHQIGVHREITGGGWLRLQAAASMPRPPPKPSTPGCAPNRSISAIPCAAT